MNTQEAEKRCKCGDPNAEFYNSMPYRCKKCQTLLTTKWKKEHREEGRYWSARYRKNNPEKAALTDKTCKKNRKLLHGAEDKKKKAKYDKEYYLKNKQKKKRQLSEYYLKSKENGMVKVWRKKVREKQMKDPMKKLHRNISSHVYLSIKNNKNNKSVFSLFEYSLKELMQHLQKLFKPGMTWANYGNWHIDHKIPVSVFNFTRPEDIDFKRCWALDNLQPMWAKENISKGASLREPFQPSLLL
jgi:hypothetical protein